MHVKEILHTLLSSVIHLKRLNTLTLLVLAALKDKKISVTLLGRGLETAATEKSNIKRSDRFISNLKIHDERESVYSVFSHRLIGHKKHPWIIVDWSAVPNSKNYILRSALVMQGRALSIYEEVHPKSKENSPEVHQAFLFKLQEILPKRCKPILVTDAGFCTPWFLQVLGMGWDYVGRVRGNKLLKLKGIWLKYKDLFGRARSTPTALGKGLLSKTNPLKTNFYLVQFPKKFRMHLNKLGKKANRTKDKEYSASWKEPWCLVSSLKSNYSVAKKVVKIYSCRMQIEEGFRDLKSSIYGFSFEHSHSKNKERLQILLMIAMVASVIAYLIGWIAERKNWHYKFQANTIRTRRVLSLFYLGCRILKKTFETPIESVWIAFNHLREFMPWAEPLTQEGSS